MDEWKETLSNKFFKSQKGARRESTDLVKGGFSDGIQRVKNGRDEKLPETSTQEIAMELNE